jgi:CBS-domain-containing membrane protein
MQKYDLEAIPVVDEMGRLVGQSPLMTLLTLSGMKQIRITS